MYLQINYSGSRLSCVIQARWELGYESLSEAMAKHNVSSNSSTESEEEQQMLRWIVEDVQVELDL